MSRKKTLERTDRVVLTTDEIGTAATRYMAGAQAHQRASTWCLKNPDAKPPNIDGFFFPAVSFELILLSVEQSLRLALLLHFKLVRDDTNHTPHVLYQTMQAKSGGYEGVRSAIIEKSNEYGRTHGIPYLTEHEAVACLRKHRTSYTNIRYFQLSHQGKLNPGFGYSPRDAQIMHCLALGLIHVNMDEMRRRVIGVLASMSAVPESEMTDELRALKERMSQGTGVNK